VVTEVVMAVALVALLLVVVVAAVMVAEAVAGEWGCVCAWGECVGKWGTDVFASVNSGER
jgi:hypothetical protein